MTTNLASTAQGTIAASRRDPRNLWREHARRLYDHLVATYGEAGPLPTLEAAWIGHQRSVNTQLSYARGFRVFEEFAREHDADPMAVRFPLADTFRTPG